MKRKVDRFYDCPGAWLGNMPDKEHKTGNIVVNPARIDPALAFLKRYYRILATSVYIAFSGAPNPGIKIDLEAKG